MREVMVQVEQMAPVSSTVLIEGESGTGKELVARAIRLLSNRRNKPFIAVNVGALPETLLESELFGHEKGAFTGAAERRLGRFELADTGTLFLDEIGEIPPRDAGQAAARARGAGVHARGRRAADRRWTCASSRRPTSRCASSWTRGDFRADLFYRLNVLRIYLPPLRERPRGHPDPRPPVHSRLLAAARPPVPRHLGRGDADARRLSVAGERARAAQSDREHGGALAGPRDRAG